MGAVESYRANGEGPGLEGLDKLYPGELANTLGQEGEGSLQEGRVDGREGLTVQMAGYQLWVDEASLPSKPSNPTRGVV